ncbi:MAG: lysophospholipid acyltransferase family protein [Endomicrobiia bacterium]
MSNLLKLIFKIPFFASIYFYTNLFLIFLIAYFRILFKTYSWRYYIYYSRKILNLVYKLGAKVYIEGQENLKKVSPPAVIVSNHMSSLETLLFGYLIGKYFKISFVVKESLLRYPILGKLIKFLEPISVTRKNPKKDFEVVLKNTKKLFNKGISIIVFPQATRTKFINEKKFNKIGIKLARIFKVELLPICVKTDFLEMGKIIKDIGKVNPGNSLYIKIFPPIRQDELNLTTHTLLVNLFKTTLNNWFKSEFY